MMRLLVIFPCYNEEAILTQSIQPFFTYFESLITTNKINVTSKICFVDDGSKDATWNLISSFSQAYVAGIKLTTNFGHQKALLAGLETFKNKFDGYVTIDVDLQDDMHCIEEMVAKHVEGFDIVYGVRNDRTSDTQFKKNTASLFYRIMKFMGVKTIPNHADYRLISNKALLALLQYPESHLFLRAIFPTIGLKSANVYYKRLHREAGTTKYSVRKMVSFAWDGISSFSAAPLRWILYLGVFAMVVSIVLLIWATVSYILGNVIEGWFSILIVVVFFGGLQTFAIGVIGEYLGKVFMQTKNRPRYLIDETHKVE
jgi:glycosyltransferase involved in cell wall biosynthesis